MHEELYHYGVKGMKWGVRKKRESVELSNKRKAVKDAKYNMYRARFTKADKQAAFNSQYNNSQSIIKQLGIYGKANRDALNDAAKASREADKAYKQSKKTYKQAKRDFKEQKTIDKFKKHGLDYNNKDTVANVYAHGYKGAKRIENRIANKKMSRFKSEMIEAGRGAATTALISAGSAAAYTLASAAINKYGNGPSMQVLDSAGKVLRSYY